MTWSEWQFIVGHNFPPTRGRKVRELTIQTLVPPSIRCFFFLFMGEDQGGL
jgi:hypothetical protein